MTPPVSQNPGTLTGWTTLSPLPLLPDYGQSDDGVAAASEPRQQEGGPAASEPRRSDDGGPAASESDLNEELFSWTKEDELIADNAAAAIRNPAAAAAMNPPAAAAVDVPAITYTFPTVIAQRDSVDRLPYGNSADNADMYTTLTTELLHHHVNLADFNPSSATHVDSFNRIVNLLYGDNKYTTTIRGPIYGAGDALNGEDIERIRKKWWPYGVRREARESPLFYKFDIMRVVPYLSMTTMPSIPAVIRAGKKESHPAIVKAMRMSIEEMVEVGTTLRDMYRPDRSVDVFVVDCQRRNPEALKVLKGHVGKAIGNLPGKYMEPMSKYMAVNWSLFIAPDVKRLIANMIAADLSEFLTLVGLYHGIPNERY